VLAGNDELYVGPLLDAGAASRVLPKRASFIWPVSTESSAAVNSETNCVARRSRSPVVDAEGGHALQQADGAGH